MNWTEVALYALEGLWLWTFGALILHQITGTPLIEFRRKLEDVERVQQ